MRSLSIRLCVFLALAAYATSWGLSAELIDTAHLDSRGVVFEAPEGNYGIWAGKGVGDVNGDGFDDVALIVRMLPLGASNPSALVLLYGGPALSGRHVIQDSLPRAVFFRTMNLSLDIGDPSPVGDINQDGFADFSVSLFPIEGNAPNAAFLVYGAPDLTGEHEIEDIGVKVPGMSFYSSDESILGIRSIVPIGDFNGDSFMDVAIGASHSTNLRGEAEGGALFVLFDVQKLSSPVDLSQVGSTIPGFRLYSTTSPDPGCCLFGTRECCDQPCCTRFGSDLGAAVCPVGDVNGDGFDDILASAPGLRPRRIYLIRGIPRPPAVIDLVEAESKGDVITFVGLEANFKDSRVLGALPGDAMTGLGDLDGDGFADFALAVTRTCCPPPGGESRDGATYIFSGRPDFPSRIEFSDLSEDDYSVAIRSTHLYTGFGNSLAAGDVNQDGVADLVIGAAHAAVGGRSDAGEAYVVYGRRDFPKEIVLDDELEGFHVIGEDYSNGLGLTLDLAGDFNGDGTKDVLLLAPQLGPQYPGPARAYIIYGETAGPQPLALHTIVPTWGSVRGGTTVVLSGSGFDAGAKAFFGDREATSLKLISRSQISVQSPPGANAGSVDVTVTAGGQNVALQRAFEYVPSFPEFDVAALGNRGFILEAQRQSGRLLTYPAISAIAFGDLSGDGVDDLIVEAKTTDAWTVTVARGGPDLPPTLPAFEPSPRVTTITTSEARSTAGATVALVGNVNGEGHGDLAIGSSDAVGYILFDEADLSDGTLDIDAAVDAGSAVRFQRSDAFDPVFMLTFASVGDLTADGIDDFVVGFAGARVEVPDSPDPGPRAGEILFVAGRTSWPQVIDLSAPGSFFSRIHGAHAGQRLASSLRQVGDLNGDGLLDLLVDTVASQGRGRAYILYGNRDLPEKIDVESYVAQGGGVAIDLLDGFDHFDWFNVSGAGDVNADGHSDILLGVEGGGGSLQGVTYLVYGGPNLPSSIQIAENPPAPDGIVRIIGEGSMEQAGRPGPAGDFNVDGFADFIIGAPGFQEFGAEAGNVFLIFGGASLPPRIDLRQLGSHGLKIDGRNILGGAGFFAGPAGDLNGDGLSDFAFSENGVLEGDLGYVYVIYNPFGGTSFIRGDANFDGAVNISDAIFTLSYLFLGGAAPLCDDAADADDSGQIEITDAIRTLNSLFLGNASIPEPYPEAGDDPTPDALGCRGF